MFYRLLSYNWSDCESKNEKYSIIEFLIIKYSIIELPIIVTND